MKPTLGDSIDRAFMEYREAVSEETGWDSRPLLAAMTRFIEPNLLTPRDEIWLRRYDGIVERIKIAQEKQP